MPTITPYLYYEDAGAALQWLAKAFGFKRAGRAMKGPDGKVVHAAMTFGEAVVMLGAPGGRYKNPRRLGQTTQSLYVTVDDADAHFERARKAGATVLQEPGDTEYGQRRYGVADPEGHEWYFAHDLPKRRRATPRTSRSRAARSRRS